MSQLVEEEPHLSRKAAKNAKRRIEAFSRGSLLRPFYSKMVMVFSVA